jgi:uncharacterized protein
VLTHSGHRLDLRDPDPSLIRLEDVAHGLAWCRRFAGTGISVAEHSILCARRAREQGEDPEVVTALLLHDAAEAFTGDVIHPVKALIVGMRKLEKALDAAILAALDLPTDLIERNHATVKVYDTWAYGVEVGAHDGPPIRLGMTARAAERAFTREHERCTS